MNLGSSPWFGLGSASCFALGSQVAKSPFVLVKSVGLILIFPLKRFPFHEP